MSKNSLAREGNARQKSRGKQGTGCNLLPPVVRDEPAACRTFATNRCSYFYSPAKIGVFAGIANKRYGKRLLGLLLHKSHRVIFGKSSNNAAPTASSKAKYADLRRQVKLILVIATAVLLIVVAIEIFSQRTITAARNKVSVSLETERALVNMRTMAAVANGSHRNYLLTGAEKHLRSRDYAYAALFADIDTLRTTLSDAPLLAALDSLDEVIASSVRGVEQSDAAYRAGNDSLALAVMTAPKMERVRDRFFRWEGVVKQSQDAAVDVNRGAVTKWTRFARTSRLVGLALFVLVVYLLVRRIFQLIGQQESLIHSLRAKNQELDHFAYIASHDLQEPLRTVSNFIEIVEEEAGDALGEDGKVYFGFINEATDRMSQLIVNLLHFSQLGRTEQKTRVDMNEILANVRVDLSATIKKNNARLTSDSLPVVAGFAGDLRQLLQNLVSNAIKFHREDVPPVVHVSCYEDNTNYYLGVADNGIGISASGQDKIFRMFSRVNAPGNYKGQGIGLAYCRKIVELHGGEISVKSTEGQGSTFSFYLPKTK